jgi:methyl-accepting chemotaxis protein
MRFITSSIRNKLLVITGTGTALLFSAATLGLWLFWNSAHQMQHLIDHEFTVEREMMQLRLDVSVPGGDSVKLRKVADKLQSLRGLVAGKASEPYVKAAAEKVNQLNATIAASGDARAPEAAQSASAALGAAVDGIAAELAQRTQKEADGFARSIVLTLSLMAAAVLLAFIVFVVFVARVILTPAHALVDDLHHFGDGDFSREVRVLSHDELGEVAESAAQVREHLGTVVNQVRDSVSRLNRAAAGMQQVVDQTLQGTATQQAESEHAATAMNQMAATVQNVVQNTAAAAKAAHEATAEAGQARVVVGDAISTIGTLATAVERSAVLIRTLADASTQIGGVLDVIQGIAEQTNLLALNAAIEAARAGEQGRGFAVVADEVRTLAQRTQVSASEIQTMVSSLQHSTSDAVRAMEESRQVANDGVEKAKHVNDSLDAITASVRAIEEMNSQIAVASEDQSKVAGAINQNILRIREVADTTARGAQEAASANRDVVSMAENLESLVGRFKV